MCQYIFCTFVMKQKNYKVMTRVSFSLFVLGVFINMALYGQNDWKKLNLKANPQSVKHIYHNVVEQVGVIKKVSILKGVYYKFNSFGFIQSQDNYGEKAKPINQIKIKYDTLNKITNKILKDSKGKLISSEIFEYNNNNQNYITTYGPDGSLSERLAYSYNKKHFKLQKIVSYDSKGQEKEVKAYSYRKRKQTKTIETSNPKSKIVHNTKLYDKDNNLIEELSFDVMGDLQLKKTNIYEGGNLMKVLIYKKDKLIIKKSFTYNNLGFLINEKVQSLLNDKIDIITYSYDFDSKANWTKKVKYINSVPVMLEERGIMYY